MIERGILFNAAGQRYIDEAKAAAAQIKSIWPQIHVTIFKHEMDDRPVQIYRIKGMQRTPYHLTIAMDTDTWMVQPVPELFDVLQQFDMASPSANVRRVYDLDVRECFHDLTPGVLAYRLNLMTTQLLKDWERRFLAHHERLGGVSHPKVGWFHSQPSFTEAVFYSKVRIAHLNSEYSWTGTGYVQKGVKIIHKRPDPQGEAERINRSPDCARTALLFDEVRTWK